MTMSIDTLKEREQLRTDLTLQYEQAIRNQDVDSADQILEMMEDSELSRTYDEQKYNTEYVDALKWKHKQETGEDYEGPASVLVEQDFEHWNFFTNNITAGALNLGDIVVNMSEAEKANALTRFQSFDDTSAWGDGSRPLWQQTKDVVGAVATDPVTYTGLGNIPKLIMKFGQSGLIKKAFAPALATASTSAAYSGLSNLTLQAQESALGGEGVDPTEVATAAGVGAFVPKGMQIAGKGIGKVGRVVTHPSQAGGELLRKVLPQKYTTTAATEGVVARAAGAVERQGSDIASGSHRFEQEADKLFTDVAAHFRERFDSFPLLGVKAEHVSKIFDKWKNTTALKMEGGAIRTMEKLEDGTLTPAQALREMKGILWNAETQAGKAQAGFSKSDVGVLHDLRKALLKVESNAARMADSKGFSRLKKEYGKWNEWKKTKFGKKLLEASTDEAAAGRLIKSMSSGDFSWSQFSKFENMVQTAERALRKGGKYKWPLLAGLQEATGKFLLEKEGRGLVDLLKQKHGMQVLKKLYPKQGKFWNSIERLNNAIPKNKGGQSISANLALARIAGNLGQTLGGRAGADVGVFGLMGFMTKITNIPWFQHAMVNAYNRRGGRLHTAVRQKLQKDYKLTAKQVDEVQDYMWALPTNAFASSYLKEKA